MMILHKFIDLEELFEQQVQNLLQNGYPGLAQLSEAEFLDQVTPLEDYLRDLSLPEEIENHAGRIPFVIVVTHAWVNTETAVSQIKIKGKNGYVDMNPLEPADFNVIEGVSIPPVPVYLLLDIDTGRETLNVTPYDARQIIQQQNRFPLTIDEGVALVTQFPEVLVDKQNYNSFSILGSRRDDQRVPAMWISYKKPRLGWCWDKNPHTWLGSASCGSRQGHLPAQNSFS